MTTPSPLASFSDSLADAVAAIDPSLVRVRTGRHLGSGIVWSAEGHVVTVAGAVGRAPTAIVTLASGAEVEANVLGVDPGLDLAVLHVPGAPAPAPRTDGARLRVGALVLVVGRPGRGVRATLGVVSGRSDEPWTTALGSTVARFIDVDAELPGGFGGGALVDAHGRIVGLNSRGLVRGGTTLPSDTVDAAVASILASGSKERAWIGVRFEPVALGEPEVTRLGAARGLLVRGVAPDSPAATAGVCVGDVLLTLGAGPLTSFADLALALAGGTGATLPLRLMRGGELLTLPVTPSEASRRWRC